ncbi:hypothetical protein [Thermobrachium celere]|uniref:Uncharacterized protein n=1 Tax=Thermobrachium celere DSM 8682 TaxID=941824 RepID=R7RR07_9CLOT|nr:hypothetical protein [Thermobrachium celere]CDF57733.1 hypothetical protein TCEL_01647 [Thermobrachium celere DSM 8682]
MRILKKLTVILISLVIFLDLFAIGFSVFVKRRVLNAEYYLGVFKSNNLYIHIKDLILKDLKAVALENNLSSDILNGLVDEKMIEDNIKRLTYGTVDYFLKVEDTLPKPNLSLAQVVKRDVEDYFVKRGFKINSLLKNEIEGIGDEINTLVENHIMFLNLGGLENNKYLIFARDVLNNVYRNINIYIMVMLISLSVLFLTSKQDALNVLSAVFEVAGITLSVPLYTLYFMKYIQNISIGDEIYKKVVVDLLNGSILYLANLGVFLIVLGFLFYLFSEFLNKKGA